MHITRPVQVALTALGLVLAFAAVFGGSLTGASAAPSIRAVQQATPSAFSCDSAATPMATPAMATPAMADDMGMDSMTMDSGTAAALPEFDQVYIDMMIPHHGSVVALAQAALPRLQNPDLQTIAQNIITSQEQEQAQLRTWRAEWYGSDMPESMDAIMTAMMTYMPEAHDLMMADMDLMDADALVARFCAEDNADLAFIDLVIPHHESAIAASRPATEQATHPELRDFAAAVIVAQEAEIEQMSSIRSMLENDSSAAAA